MGGSGGGFVGTPKKPRCPITPVVGNATAPGGACTPARPGQLVAPVGPTVAGNGQASRAAPGAAPARPQICPFVSTHAQESTEPTVTAGLVAESPSHSLSPP